MTPRIQVIGSLNVDYTTLTARFPGPGETLTAKSLTVNAGGKGANQCVACGRASFTSKTDHDVEVEMIGAVGANDPYYASLLKPMLEESGVNCSGINEFKGAQTGTATVIVDEGNDGENRILVVPGANHEGMKDSVEVLQRSLNRDTNPDVVVLQGEIPRATVFEVITQLHAKTAIVFNPAPVFPEGIPRELLGMVKVLIVNETEIVQVMADATDGKDLPAPGDDLDEVQLNNFTDSLHLTGLELVIMTLGSRGAFYSSGLKQGKSVESAKVSNVVDTTAAGDTFVGCFSVALARYLYAHKGKLEGFDVGAAILRSNQQAAKCVQRAGAMQSIPFGYE
jgi:ribokinase